MGTKLNFGSSKITWPNWKSYDQIDVPEEFNVIQRALTHTWSDLTDLSDCFGKSYTVIYHCY